MTPCRLRVPVKSSLVNWLPQSMSMRQPGRANRRNWLLSSPKQPKPRKRHSMWSPPLAIPYVLMATGMTLLCVQILLQLMIPLAKAFSSEVGTGSRQENASNQESKAAR